jgi:type IV secretory pathway protease TraF
MSGDHVSTLHGELRINGAFVDSVLDTDAAGRTLPRWRGDRVLTDGELFVGSTRIEHSFDSRFFGPVRASQIVGVYRRLTFGVSSDDTPQPSR